MSQAGSTWGDSSDANAPAVIAPFAFTPADASGTITTGGTPQEVMAANPNRCWFLFQNNSNSAVMWLSWTTATPTVNGAGCFSVQAGGSYPENGTAIPGSALYVYCATTNAAFTAQQGSSPA